MSAKASLIHTPEQREAIETLGENLCVDAGAGSGKTRVLVDRILHLLEHKHADLNEIVAITFTEKAAAEMKERLRAAFRNKAPLDDPEKMSFWRDLERRISTARITTIHAFCAKLLRENALALGLDPDFTLLSDTESGLLRGEVVTDTLHALLDARDEDAMAAAQEYGVGPLIATLDSLLRRSGLVRRIAEANPLTSPEELQVHWAKLVREEHERRLLSLRKSPRLVRFREKLEQFDGKCAKPSDARENLRAEMLALCERIPSTEEPKRIEALIESVLSLSPRGARKSNWDSEEIYAELTETQKAFTAFLKKYTPPQPDPDLEARAALLVSQVFALYRRVEDAFTEAKSTRAAMDFEDLITNVYDMFRENEGIRKRSARGIRHLLIDEFQDTDGVQLDISRKLMGNAGGDGGQLFFVGDAKQSIYDFRGAEVEVFAEVRDTADRTISLLKNFRSLPGVLAFINDFFGHSGILEVGGIDFEPLQAHREAVDGAQVEFLVPEGDDDAKADEGRRKEAELIAWRIAALCSDETIGFGDVAILFRSTTSMYLYEESLRKHDIPFNVVAGAGFYERQEISDLRNLLTTLVDPYNEMALLGFLRSPMAGLSDEAILGLSGEGGLPEVFQSSVVLDDLEQNQRLNAARELVQDLRSRAEIPLPAFLRRLLDVTAYEAVLLSQYHGVQKASNVRKVIRLAEDFTRATAPGLRAFVRYLDQVASKEIREGDAPLQAGGSGAVTLLTIHKAKGLEFPVVILPDCARGLRASTNQDAVRIHRRLGCGTKVTGPDGERATPGIMNAIKQAEDEQAEAEHARILYVALTRARDRLLISGAPYAKSTKGSWFEGFQEAFGLLECRDGDTISGRGWQAVVHRVPGEFMEPPIARQAAPVFSKEALLRRVLEVESPPRFSKSFSITELLATGLNGAAWEPAATDSQESVSVDPQLRGTLVHSLLEQWDFAGQLEAPVGEVIRNARLPLQTRNDLEHDLQEMAETFKKSEIFKRLSSDRHAQKEVPFLLRDGEIRLKGVIDVLFADGTLLDYKTGAHKPAAHRRYEKQLQLYAVALRRLRNIDPPEGLIYYLDSSELCRVDVSRELCEGAYREVLDKVGGRHA